MTATKGVGTYGNAAGTVTPLDHKMAQLGLVAKTSGNAIRAGLFWGGSATIVSGKANMSYDVAPFTAVLSRGSTAGAVLLSNDGTYNVSTTAAPGSNSRIDIVYVWQREYSIDGTDSNPVIGVVQGTPAASPTAPSLASFPGAISLAQITVPSGITATTSATITQTAPFTANSGGVIPFRNTTERDAGTYVESQLGWLMDSDVLQQYSGSAWATIVTSTGMVPMIPSSVSGTGVSVSSDGLVSFTAATTASGVNVNGCFTSAYRNYMVVFDITSSSTTLTPRFGLRGSGSTDTGASNYGYRQVLDGTSAHSGAVGFWRLAPDTGSSTAGFGKLTVFAPQLSIATRGLLEAGSAASTSSGSVLQASLFHNQVAQYDGFTMSPATGTFGGTVRIYGLT